MVVGFAVAEDSTREDDERSENANDDGIAPKKTSSVRRSIFARRLTSYRYFYELFIVFRSLEQVTLKKILAFDTFAVSWLSCVSSTVSSLYPSY